MVTLGPARTIAPATRKDIMTLRNRHKASPSSFPKRQYSQSNDYPKATTSENGDRLKHDGPDRAGP